MEGDMEKSGISSFNLTSEKKEAKSACKKNQRLQSGYFHVWARGNCRFTVFHDEEDFTGFLTRCNKFAINYESKITSFVLMDNHVHLQVYTQNLKSFISALLISFSQWLNKRKGLTGSLFQSPFSSSQIYSADILERNILYILTNPVRAGICESIKDYPWSSYHSFKPNHLNPLHKYINVDTTVMKSFFTSLPELDKRAKEFIWNADCKAQEILFNKNTKPTFIDKDIELSIEDYRTKESTRSNTTNWHKIPDYEISRYLKRLLQERNLTEISKEEFVRIVKILKFQGNATIQQIASLTHESYGDIRRFINRP